MAKIDKSQAAERLIVSAIEMIESGSDRLACHLVATSALGLLRELMRHDDKEYVTELLKMGMFTLAQSRANDEDLNLPVPPEINGQIDELAASIVKGEVTSADDLSVTKEGPWKLLAYIVDPSNFLKHADRDPLATLEESEFDPEGAVQHALTAYTFVRPSNPLPDKIKPYLKRHDLLHEAD